MAKKEEQETAQKPSPLLYHGSPMSHGKLLIPVLAEESSTSIPPGKEALVKTGIVYNHPGCVAMFQTMDSSKFIVNSIQELVPGVEVVLIIKNTSSFAWKVLKGQVVSGMVVVEAVLL
jgi:hypothetical protein